MGVKVRERPKGSDAQEKNKQGGKKKYSGVYSIRGRRGVSYGIDYYHPQTGERIRKVIKGVKTAAEAFRIKSIEIADAERGAINKAYAIKAKVQAIPFVPMTEAYIEWAKENKRSWKTDFYRIQALKEAFKDKLLSDIHPLMIERYKKYRREKVSKSTINKELILGSQVFEKAIEWKKYPGGNPFQLAKRYQIKKGKKPGSLSPDEVQAIMDEVQHPVKKDMVEFAFNTRWRISEIRKLRWEDVNLDSGMAWIVDPKNTETVEIELNDEAMKVISRQRRRSDFVFCHINGKPFKTNLHKAIKNAAKRAGIILPPRKAWHIFRRTWVSMMLQSGCDIETLRELGNWKDYAMPMLYADAGNSGLKRKMLNRLPKLGQKLGRNWAEKDKVINLSDGNL